MKRTCRRQHRLDAMRDMETEYGKNEENELRDVAREMRSNTQHRLKNKEIYVQNILKESEICSTRQKIPSRGT